MWVFFFPSLAFLEVSELSPLLRVPLASRPKLASLGQLKAAINLHFFGKGTPCPEAAFALEVLGSGPGFDGEVPQGW